jgi:hypothetical protein
VFVDSTEGARMNEIFLDDLTRATEITADAWSRRGPWTRVMERGAAVFQRLL